MQCRYEKSCENITKMQLLNYLANGLVILFLFMGISTEAHRSRKTINEDSEEIEEFIKPEKVWITGNVSFTSEKGDKVNEGQSVVKLASFNLQKFGNKKAAKEDILKIIAKIVTGYDLIALQEITDANDKAKAVKKLVDTVNQESTVPYEYVVSPRVGRGKQKEQYLLLYRPDIFEVKSDQVYDDSEGDPFSREPHLCEVVIKSNGEKFGLINVHVAPARGNASFEIDSLADVHSWVQRSWRLRNVLIVGDLNADCSYIRKKDIPSIRLVNNPKKYRWLITDNFDTTVGNSNCAYDRIISSGPYFSKNLVYDSPRVYQFDKEFGLDIKRALSVSDHYPVEISIYVGTPPGTAPHRISSSGGPTSSLLLLLLLLLFIYL